MPALQTSSIYSEIFLRGLGEGELPPPQACQIVLKNFFSAGTVNFTNKSRKHASNGHAGGACVLPRLPSRNGGLLLRGGRREGYGRRQGTEREGREFPLKVRVSKINIITIICQRVCLVVLGMR